MSYLSFQEDYFARANDAANYIRQQCSLQPQIALVLGSGLGSFASELTEPTVIHYAQIPHFPLTGAEGHAGNLVIGKIGDVPVAAMQGRVHLYEGYSPQRVTLPMRVFACLGIKAALLTNAAGGISTRLKQGCLVVLKDHINLQGSNPLIGPNVTRFGPRFPDMTEAYAKDYRAMAMEEGKRVGIDISEGVYAALTGPSYETPAEIHYLRTIGADTVGMSTVPEVIVARHCGMKVLAISCVTNMAAGMVDHPLTHEEVLATGEKVKTQFVALLRAVIPRMAGALS
ncbi:MAG TPA: purine-nucleoside phosphorylase [Candidatus Saccharimonadales bacterium]|jgi:purine-nucleoside phosphorylase|nr:purine-nucleoside phosphorylase [Candidatus Saccharimonadales bacterium]